MATKQSTLNLNALPKHIGFIIDGNGRWAQKRGLSRSMGHKAGLKALVKVVDDCFEFGINIVSIFGFSTENWNRPKDEIDYLFELFRDFIKKNKDNYVKREIRLNIMGDYTKFPKDLVAEVEDVILKTQHFTKYIVNLGINYGGRDELVRAVNLAIESGKKNITKQEFSNYLYTAGMPDLDFVVRTSGEQRVSNFMLWQMAYAEFYFPKVYWPSFNKHQLTLSLLEFQSRNRRFGAIKENK